MKHIRNICLALTSALLLPVVMVGCGSGFDMPEQKKQETNPIEKVSSDMISNSFNDRFLSYIADHREGNYMVSPLSFKYALGLLLAGAEGNTKTELLSALGVAELEEWTEDCKNFNSFAQQYETNAERERENIKKEMEQGYIEKGTVPERALRIANSVWINEAIGNFKDGYSDYVTTRYSAENLKFNLENAVSRVNAWADEKTNHMIPELLPQGYDVKHLAAILMNAIYFKDAFVEPFNKSLTADGDFTKADGSTVKKSFMHKTEIMRYYSDDATELVIIPMKGSVSMAVVLGDDTGIAEKISDSNNRNVSLTLPKIDLETSFENKEFISFLAENGVKAAFDRHSADFSLMTDTQIYVDDIIQKTKIKLDEEGVEAAAVTAIMMRCEGVDIMTEEPVSFTADRPFSFYIYSTVNDTTEIMFAGRIVE